MLGGLNVLQNFMTKKFINQTFSVITMNLNLEILTKNLVTFKRWNGAKDEKFSFYGVH